VCEHNYSSGDLQLPLPNYIARCDVPVEVGMVSWVTWLSRLNSFGSKSQLKALSESVGTFI
jgi:hypothetical protein